MADFHPFADATKTRFDEMSKGELFVVNIDKDVVWEAYLAAFPEGENPIYRERTEHDCSCCKNFVRNVGNVVAVVNGKLQSVWSVSGLEYPYSVVAEKLAELIETASIDDLFRTKEASFGAKQSKELLADGTVKKWNHFYASVDRKHLSNQVDMDLGNYRTTAHVFKRGLVELTPEAFQTVRDLIESKSLYRGEEFLASVLEFQKQQTKFNKLDAQGKETFVWTQANSPASRFRNTAIGTLVQDLSAGEDLEKAVRSFEAKVAPTNYKRPTALITPRMVEDAMKTIKELDLEAALERRFARISDVSVNNVLWVDNASRSKMRDGIADVLMAAAVETKQKQVTAPKDITIDDFMEKVVPSAQSIELMVKNSQQSNFVSLTAPVHQDSGNLFKWNNDFAWSYDGNITDSIKEKVKRAGGNTNAPFRVSLAWFNFDDLDIYVTEPNGNVITFYNKSGKLDVDMNAGGGRSREPVENVSFTRPADGTYIVQVNQYSQRETTDVGFVIEIENNGTIHQYSHTKVARGTIKVGEITLTNGQISKINFSKDMVGGSIPQEKWGIETEKFVKVSTLMKSPNYWDENAVGNKHWFFILEGCKNDLPARGIYNEFLNSKFETHRKVFEVLGDRTKCQPTDDQLSGVGFSSTKGDSVIVKVLTSKGTQQYNINF